MDRIDEIARIPLEELYITVLVGTEQVERQLSNICQAGPGPDLMAHHYNLQFPERGVKDIIPGKSP